MGCLKIIRWILACILAVILILLIVIGIPFASFSKLVSSSENVKTWLKNGKVYESVDDTIIDLMLGKSGDQNDLLEFTTEEELKELAGNILTSSWVEENSLRVIDAVYAWLNGETNQVIFEIELTEEQQSLQSAIYDLFKQHILSLPECEDVSNISPDDFNPLQTECLPADFSEEELEKELEDMLPSEIFEKTTISSDEIFKDNKVIAELTERVQQIFKYFKSLQVYVIVIIISLSFVLFFVIPGFKNGFFFTGLVWFISSSLVLFGGYYSKNNFDRIFESQVQRFQGEEAGFVINLIKEPVKLAYFDVLSETSHLGLVVVVLGMILVFGGIILKLSRRRYYVREDVEEGKEEADQVDDGNEVEALEEAVNLEGSERIARPLRPKSTEGGAVGGEVKESTQDSKVLPTSPLGGEK